MHEYWHVILHSLIDTAKILPILFIVYYLIELFEYKFAKKIQNNNLFKGKASPFFGAVLGCVPQCGFSVVSTDLFSKGIISVGGLLAVYIATSDESIPLLIANPKFLPYMLLLILIKIVFGITIGYLAILLHNLIFKKSKYINNNSKSSKANSISKHKEKNIHPHDEIGNKKELNKSSSSTIEHDHNHSHEEEIDVVHGGCCHHHVESKSFDWLHPLLHCLKISAFILVITTLFGIATEVWIGKENLNAFITNSKFFQPLIAVLIGLIPNCVSSVILTNLFLTGGLKFGALVAGLCVNAGLGLFVLLKQNKNWKENLFIILMLVIPSLLLGYTLLFI